MTWVFVYVAVLLLGLVIAATSGLLRRLTIHALRHPVTVPAPEHHSAVANLLAQRASLALVAFGAAGTATATLEPWPRLVVALLGGLAGGLAAIVLIRYPAAPLLSNSGSVVRAIPPGGYGQVEVHHGDRTLRLAARSEDGGGIPEGALVELVDCESSVMTVRRRTPGAAA